ncbi:hypothetical protein A2767_06825 [Candidatus Roizmanbacteria bacterium RIFCSPHIGHO2_01_FULL_35_10]|uniref:Glycosyltransferase 2-like domain-containing protein n=1 Tax=Candidatus Roizmanbacteria bacterium RIFCSPLOWO2_01_FULL_35_13 TaxID=1802055 RepID=A0A1F7I7J6_9BACT|nr:MAG: hypothetical protein A2767_06825 [Candidatus Roizmanbacteria bacterium RIFCSPHIGHO2_01_FULL_35_10]OGK39345.1 MAG: hypothetical protein A3A74_05240 [Candidatus Roizmanbacteria bacterium RIFCSPLOWO2_01_FULL_35_13]
MKYILISIIIPVYKNYEMFFRNLKNNKKYIDVCEVLVMNDYPQEKIAKEVKQIIPDAITIDNELNLGFGSNVNAGVKKAKGEFVLLLNSDVILKDDSFKKSVEVFKKDKSLFALSFAQYESDGKLIGANRGFFQDGLINHDRQLITDNRRLTTNFWAEGGSSIFRKSLFLKLGSFDQLYNPFYWEDIDLSYRAWKSGYKIYYYPAVKVQHYHESTIGKFFQKSSIMKTAYRNQFIFNWKNITDQDLFIKHLLFLPILLIRSIFTGNLILLQGFFLALVLLPKIIGSRKKAVKLFRKKDKEILDLFK